jgi:hypothetical protein
MRAVSLLSLVARIRPEAWDAIIPHTPLTAGSRVALNPQPLPPGEAFVVEAARMAHEVVRLAVEAGLRGESTGFVREFVDDWCGTPWPHKWPWPWPGPRPGGEPEPSPDLVGIARAAGAVVFAAAGSRLPDGELGAAFAAGAEQLAKAAIG